MKITNLRKNWVSIVEDVDCGNLDLGQRHEVFELFARRKLVIFKDQHLDNDQLKQFCSIFGWVWDRAHERYSGLEQSVNTGHDDSFVEVVSETGLLSDGVIPWHIDLTHFPSQLIPNRILYAVELEGSPAGTRFIDTIQGLDLVERSKRMWLANATALCKAPYKTPWNAVVRRPALNWHPIHKDWALIADELFTQALDNPNTFEEQYPSRTYQGWIKEVISEMQSIETTYTHNWELNDLMVYDNWSTMHYRDAFQGKRKLKRVTWDQIWNQYGMVA